MVVGNHDRDRFAHRGPSTVTFVPRFWADTMEILAPIGFPFLHPDHAVAVLLVGSIDGSDAIVTDPDLARLAFDDAFHTDGQRRRAPGRCGLPRS